MELKAFLAELVSSLARLDFVASIELRTEAFTVKGRVHLTQRGFLEVYFNERTQTIAVAWIEAERRRWGIDRDNLRGWHRHPLENPEDHQAIPAMSIPEIIVELHGAGAPIKRRSLLLGSAKGLSLRVPMALPSGCRA